MRVLHLDSSLDWRGGQQQVSYLADGLKTRPLDQKLVVRAGGRLADRLRSQDLLVRTLRLRSEWDPASLVGLGRIIGEFRPDIVHAHDSRTLGMAVFLKKLGQRFRLVASRRVAFPVRSNPLWKQKYQKSPDRIIAVSRYIEESLIRQGIAPQKIKLIYDGLRLPVEPRPEERSVARKRFGVAEGGVLIGTVGSFTEEKGHEVLIRGFKRIVTQRSGVRLLLVGDGPLRGRISRLIHDLGLEAEVIIESSVSDLGSLIPALDLFVYPSLVEGLGSVLLLAMAYRIPVCASRTRGIPELVVPGETGHLFPPGNAEALAEQVMILLASLTSLEGTTRNAFKRVKNEFLVDRMVSKTYDLYTDLLRN
jgi:glycosyltransferase involved in cell wall biosynthesis